MKRIQDILLIIVFAFSIFLYSYSLSTQEFVGDEAGPMLSIDRMWDSIPLKDIRFLAYPYLFYHEPYRAIFSGTLLHFFGPDRIILRLPSVIFGLLTFGLLTYIFKKEKVAPWLAILAMVTYFISPLITYDRSGRLSDQSSFFFLLTSYLIWQGSRQNNIQKLRLSLITFAISVLTILDSIILVPGIISVFIKKRLLIDRKTTYLISCLILLGTLYFIAWLVLPYLTFRSGFQNYYDNRGLFYYISRARSGILTSPLEGLKSLINYTSIPFSLWIILTSVLALKIKISIYLYHRIIRLGCSNLSKSLQLPHNDVYFLLLISSRNSY